MKQDGVAVRQEQRLRNVPLEMNVRGQRLKLRRIHRMTHGDDGIHVFGTQRREDGLKGGG